MASFFPNIGIDPKTEYEPNVGRPVTLIRDRSPIPDLVSQASGRTSHEAVTANDY
ncbi:MAG: hypothetical protein P8K08_00255 [Fuerstiella sp.]|jgi:hypothetical protein|nr:hypothetical protein [Fuerstiella sp.]